MKNCFVICKLFFLTLISVTSFSVFAQKEGNIWYFGDYGGLDFNSGTPAVLENGQMSCFEGVASIADPDGNLLFYTNGMTVYNKNHQVMQNGTGLLGHTSSTQSGVIVPLPLSSTQFVIFTVDYASNDGKLHYSTVDITLAGGLGAVVNKNIFIQTNSAEKISAVRHQNQQDIWVVIHERANNVYKSYLVTSAGVLMTPVVSSTGPVLGSGAVGVQGCLKFSADGNRLAMATYGSLRVDVSTFNKATGAVTYSFGFNYPEQTYGVEFSADGQFLYATVSYNLKQIYQINIQQHTNVLIANTAMAPGGLQLAPDGKIYVARYDRPNISSKYLGIINNPEVAGAGCNYVDQGLYLGAGASFMGLPTFIQSYFFPRSFNYTGVCYGSPTSFTIANPTGIDSAHWNFDDPASGSNNFARVMAPFHLFTAPGSYNVQLTVYDNGIGATSVQMVEILALPVVNLGNDQTLCGVPQLVLDAGPGYAEYEWSNGWPGRYFTAVNTGTYAVTVTTSAGCIGNDQISLVFWPAPGAKLIKHN